MRNEWVRANEDPFNPTKNRSICADPESQAEDCENRKARTAPEHPEAEAKILKKRLHLWFASFER
jgi:hypothetical protein